MQNGNSIYRAKICFGPFAVAAFGSFGFHLATLGGSGWEAVGASYNQVHLYFTCSEKK